MPQSSLRDNRDGRASYDTMISMIARKGHPPLKPSEWRDATGGGSTRTYYVGSDFNYRYVALPRNVGD